MFLLFSAKAHLPILATIQRSLLKKKKNWKTENILDPEPFLYIIHFQSFMDKFF